MRAALRRLPLERAAQVVLTMTILAFVAGSSSVAEVRDIGLPGRWLALVVLVAVAALFSLSVETPARLTAAPLAAAALFLELAFLSALWSVDVRLTLARAASLTLLFASATLLALAAAARPRAAVGVLRAVVAAAALAALAGIALAVWRPDDAFVEATLQTPRRFQGIGGNPNTVSMLLALALAPALLLVVRAPTRARRVGAAAVVALLAGSIVASGSRGALLAAGASTLVFSLAGLTGRVRLAATATVLACCALAIVLVQLPQPLDTAPAAPAASGPNRVPRYLDAELYRRLEDDVGHPPFGEAGISVRRTLFGSSGRAQAWEGAIEQGLERPVVGYGFGTEGKAFVDRYVVFLGSLPENSYIGLFLQLGVLGLFLFLLVPVLLVAVAARRLRRFNREARLVAATCGAVVVGGLAVAVAQSYLYAVGNVATVALWTSAFLLVAAPAWERTARP